MYNELFLHFLIYLSSSVLLEPVKAQDESELTNYLIRNGITSKPDTFITWKMFDKCVAYKYCFLKGTCCLNYLKQLFDSDLKNNSIQTLLPECYSVVDIDNKNNPVYYKMTVWSGCYHGKDYESPFNTSLVYDKKRFLFYKSYNEAICFNKNVTDFLLILPNYRLCTPNVTDYLKTLTNKNEALQYFLNNCVLLSVAYMNKNFLLNYLKSPNTTATEINNLFRQVMQCNDTEYYNYSFADNITNALQLPINILCNIVQLKNISITLFTEAAVKTTVKNIFCYFLYNYTYKSMTVVTTVEANPSPGTVPSLVFLFDVDQQNLNDNVYSLSEKLRLSYCETNLEIYNNIEMCEILNCLSITTGTKMELFKKRCSVLDSFEKVISISMYSYSSEMQTVINDLIQIFNLTIYNQYGEFYDFVFTDDSNVTYYFKLDYPIFLNKSTIRYSLITEDLTKLNSFRRKVSDLFSLISTSFSLSIQNYLPLNECFNETVFNFLNVSNVFQEIYFSKYYNVTKLFEPCQYNQTNGNLCKIIPYNIITEGNAYQKFLSEYSQNYAFINSSFALKKICNNDSRIYLDNSNQYNPADFYITTILIPISLLGLTITIMIYSIFTELHTLPGLMVVAMSCHLLIAYCGFITIALHTMPGINCIAAIIITHFSLLSCFCWMTLISIDSSITFASRKLTIRKSNKIFKRFLIFNFIILILVLIFWLPGIINYACGYLCLTLIPVIYDNTLTCWLYGNFSILYGITVPGLITSVVSFVSLTWAIIGFVRSMNESKNLTNSKNPNMNSKLILLFSIKLGVLTGVTFGMMQLSVMLKWKFINTVFSGINSTIGLLICILFTCNDRVFRMFKKTIKRQNTLTVSMKLSTNNSS